MCFLQYLSSAKSYLLLHTNQNKPHNNLTKCVRLHYDNSAIARLSANKYTGLCFSSVLQVIRVTNSKTTFDITVFPAHGQLLITVGSLQTQLLSFYKQFFSQSSQIFLPLSLLLM